MKFTANIEEWADAHHPKWLDVVRIFLGLVLIAKGIAFIRETDLMQQLAFGSSSQVGSIVLAHYVIGVQLAAGLMITFGLLTRVAALFMIPILLTGLFFVNLSREFFVISSEIPYLILILMLLVFFFIYGSGPLSVDNYIKKHPADEESG